MQLGSLQLCDSVNSRIVLSYRINFSRLPLSKPLSVMTLIGYECATIFDEGHLSGDIAVNISVSINSSM